MAEEIDIFDANLKKIGCAERLSAHQKGEWHRTFHLWIVSSNDGGSLLFQLRSPTAKNYPNLLDVSAAGHLRTGEELSDGVREVVEELGVEVKFDQLHWLGYRVEVADQDNGQHNREYQGVFLLKEERPLDQYHPDSSEVYGLVSIPIAEGMKLFSSDAIELTANCLCYSVPDRVWIKGKQNISKKRFLPRIQNYYLTMLIMAERLLAGQTVLGIS